MKTVSKNLVAIYVFAVSLLVLVLHVHGLPHSGQASYILCQKLGVDPFPTFANPVYGWIVKVIALVAGASVVRGVQLFSAVCGSGVLVLIFLFVYRMARAFNIDKNFSPPHMHRIQLAAGIFSVLYLMAAIPFCQAATRASPLPFDLLLLLSSFYLAVSCSRDNCISRLSLSALIYGIATVEFSTAILMSPLFGILVLIRLWSHNHLSMKNMLLIAGAGVAGLLLYLIQAGLFMANPSYTWREFSSFFEVLRYIWLEQYQTLTLTLSRVGWLTLGLVSLLPWLITSALRIPGGSARNRHSLLGTSALNLMLGALAVLTLLDFPLAPLSLTGSVRLFVTPYVIISLWVGNVTAFWLAILFREKRFESHALTVVRRVSGIVMLVTAPLYMVFVSAARALPQTYGPVDTAIQKFASEVVNAAADREWLVTNTGVDDQISLEVFRRKLPLKVVKLSYGRSVVYMRYVASLFAGDARLESLASIGMAPLLDEWFIRMPDVEKRVAVVHVPDLWMIAGLEAIPDRVLFGGARQITDKEIDRILQINRAFWSDYGVDVSKLAAGEGAHDESVQWIATHLSKVANNMGVFLEDHGRPDDAFECYKEARLLAPDNLSALMNMHVLAEREHRPEFDALEEELKTRAEKLAGKVQTMALSYVYGFVRLPELFANRGLAFAMSGKASQAISDMKKALELKQSSPQLQIALAGMYFAQEKDVESRQYYIGALENDPANKSALLGMLRIALRQQNIEEARSYLERLKATDMRPEDLKFEEAILEAFAGSAPLAIRLLQDVVKAEPQNMRAWAAIAITAAQLGDSKLGETAMQRLSEAKLLTPDIQLVMAQAALDQNDRDGARRYLNDILRKQPGNIKALEMLLRIYLSEGDRDKVQGLVENILNVDQGNALANYMLGVHHFYREEYALAESSYRASIATYRAPEALNDLAYVLYIQDKLEEAEQLIRESIKLNDANSASWDTLGVIMMKKGRLGEAEEALLKSLAIRPGAASVTLSLALLYEKQERWKEAEGLAEDVGARMNELPPGDQTTLRNLQQRLADRH